MKLKLLENTYSICRMDDNDMLPTWAMASKALIIAKIEGELSVICESRYVPQGIVSEDDYRIIKIDEKLEFSLIGIMADLTGVLKKAEISLLAESTFDTDYIMIKADKIQKATEFLQDAGYEFV